MNPEQFKEVIGVVMMTTKKTQKEIAEYLEVCDYTIQSWKRKGVALRFVPIIMDKFKQLIRGR